MRTFGGKFILIYIFIILIFLTNWNKTIASEYEKGYILFLNLQNLIKNIIQNLKESLFFIQEDSYKVKYYNLLKQLAQIKIAEQEKLFLKSLELIKERYPNVAEAKNISSEFGIIYAYSQKEVKVGSPVIDENWMLVGFVRKVLKSGYLEIVSLNYPNLQFNVINLDGINIGLSKTTGLGYIEVNFVDPKTKVKVGDLLMTMGDEVFPRGFLFGEIFKIENLGNMQKLYVTPLANFSSSKLIIPQ